MLGHAKIQSAVRCLALMLKTPWSCQIERNLDRTGLTQNLPFAGSYQLPNFCYSFIGWTAAFGRKDHLPVRPKRGGCARPAIESSTAASPNRGRPPPSLKRAVEGGSARRRGRRLHQVTPWVARTAKVRLSRQHFGPDRRRPARRTRRIQRAGEDYRL